MPVPRLEQVKQWIGVRHLLSLVRVTEAWWFDATRHISTAGEATLENLTLVGDGAGGNRYSPVRPVAARRVLRALPITDYANYTFLDIGSGKGRMLFLAAEYPFREIIGIEFAAELHARAEANIRGFRSAKQQCRRIRSLSMDARDFSFPPGPLVLFFYNPFGESVMREVLSHLEASLDAAPREVLMILLYPEQAHLLEHSRHFRSYLQTYHYHIYRHAPAG